VPGARITLEVLDGSGERVEKKPLSFYYADFLRHGDESERPELMDDAQVEFENVMIDVDA
jgi:hypothetical protein